jgi:hypothetical protein
MWHAWERRESCIMFWWESLKERNLLEDNDIDGRMESEWVLGRSAGRRLSGSNWLWIGAVGRLL